MKHWHTLLARINRASLRERALVFGCAVVVLAALWQQLLIAPIEARRATIAASLDALHKSTTPGAGGVADAYAALRSRELALTEAIADTDTQLRDAQRGMIEPKQMVKVLTEVLAHQTGLSLVLLRNLPVQSLMAAAGAAPAAADPGAITANSASAGPYLHPVEIVVRGDYLSVLAYLQALESQQRGFQWRRFELAATEQGPEYHIEFTTLSMDANWLGV
jgi:MSHA biogenesis protein MshJ